MTVTTKMKLILKLTTYAVCTIGLFVQTSYISSRYFMFNSKTTIVVDIPSDINLPSLSSCFKFNDIINLDYIRKDKGLNLKRWTDLNYSSIEFHQSTSMFTVSDWFKYTPAIAEVFADNIGCRIRYPKRYASKPYNSSECHKFFQISKNLIGDVMCYTFKPVSVAVIVEIEYLFSPSFKDSIYSINYNMSLFGTLSEVKHIIHYKSDFVNDFLFAKTKPLSQRGNTRSDITYQEFNRVMLGPPYVPTCDPRIPRSRTSTEFFMTFVNHKAVTMFNFVVPFIPINESFGSAVAPSYLNYYNDTFVTTLNELIESTPKPGGTCNIKFFKTIVSFVPQTFVSSLVQWPSSETFIVIYIPDQDAIDFIVYICSCVGIWLGLSAFSSLELIISCCNSVCKRNNVAQMTDVKSNELQLKIRVSKHDVKVKQHDRKVKHHDLKILLLQQYVNELHNLVKNHLESN